MEASNQEVLIFNVNGSAWGKHGLMGMTGILRNERDNQNDIESVGSEESKEVSITVCFVGQYMNEFLCKLRFWRTEEP